MSDELKQIDSVRNTNNLNAKLLKKQLGYWQSKLSGYESLNLITDKVRPLQIDYAGKHVYFEIDVGISCGLRDLAKNLGVSLHSVLLSGFCLMLKVYSNQDDIVIGTPVANRHYPQIEELIGFFVNILVLRQKIDSKALVVDFIQEVDRGVIEAQLYQDLPFEKLVEELNIPKDTSRHPIFQVMFGVNNLNNGLGEEEGTRLLADIVEDYSHEQALYSVAKFDLSGFVDASQEELRGSFNYASGLFNEGTIEGFIDTYINILRQFSKLSSNKVAQENTRVQGLSYIGVESYQQIIHTWNATEKAYPRDKPIQQMFEEQVVRTPDRVAVVYEDLSLTYRELNERANRLAHYLIQSYEIQPDSLVALCLDRSEKMMIAILGVLKSGGAYVPIDPSYPDERIAYVLEDTKARVIISNKIYQDRIESLSTHRANGLDLGIIKPEVVCINDDRFQEELSYIKTSNPDTTTTSHNLAYVIYTSGTTGRPKGVMVAHASFVAFLISFIDVFADKAPPSNLNTLSATNYCFDIFGLEYGLVLIVGGTIHLNDLLSKAMPNILNYKFIQLTPTKASLLFDALLKNESPISGSTKTRSMTLVLGGERLERGILDKVDILQARYPNLNISIINAYGPTETTIWSSIFFVTNREQLKIGKPLPNETLYVLDNDLNILPISAIGELYIGGAGLARGYLHQPKLTAERFIANPFQTKEERLQNKNWRLYKTGDLVRWMPDGNLEYIGRNDFQVKIRGFRIELGEIEAVLGSYPGVGQSVVVARARHGMPGDGANGMYLIGYYVVQASVDEEQLYSYLEAKLPEYMVPSNLVCLESLPLTVNGKLDRNALPEPEFVDEDNYVAPRNELEAKLTSIYAEVLELEADKVGINDNFFSLGGNSISVIKLEDRLNKLESFKNINITDLFRYTTIDKLISFYSGNKELDVKLQRGEVGENEIAIIGMSGSFSGCESIAQLWNLVSLQQEGIKEYGIDKCCALGVTENLLKDKGYIAVGGHIEGIELFDAPFWGLSEVEARQIDPQIRKFVEHCWYALEVAGYIKERKRLNIGVFAGSGYSSYLNENILQGENTEEINLWQVIHANVKDALATKVSYLLGLTGPANSINTACSTGLVNVVEACQKLALGICDMALAGSVSLLMPYQIGYVYEEGMILSRDGHCRTFDKESSGTVNGSGVGVVLLKPLSKAIADKDNIIAVIKGYATNNDGDRKSSYVSPSIVGQSECIVNAQKKAGVVPEDIDYIECHGTATKLGDAIEIQALKDAFKYSSRETWRENKCVLGGLKANIGHTDSAAGIAGLIKVCCMLQAGIIPGQINYQEANPELDLEESSFEVIKENRKWERRENKARLAGVSSFGIGGTNAHVIISEYVARKEVGKQITIEKTIDQVEGVLIFPLSAKSLKSVELYRSELVRYLDLFDVELNDVAHTLQRKKEDFEYKIAFSALNKMELIARLKDSSFSPCWSGIEVKTKVVYMFPGQGSQYQNMGIELYQNEGYFRNEIDKCIGFANKYLNIDLRQILYPSVYGKNGLDINQTQWAQICIFIVSYALAKFLKHLGIGANGYIGHSIGEYVAACLSGIFEIEDAIKIVIKRGSIMQSMLPGGMVAINAPINDVVSKIEGLDVEIAAINSIDNYVVSGVLSEIDKLISILESAGVAYIKLKTSHAYHSKLMDDAVDKYFQEVAKISLHKPNHLNPIVTIDGTRASDAISSAAYWAKQIRKTVDFNAGVNTLYEILGNNILFIEVGAGKGLGSFVSKHSITGNRFVTAMQMLPSMKEVANKNLALRSRHDIRAKLWMHGLKIDFTINNIQTNHRVLPLPVYQFDWKKHWIERTTKGYNNFIDHTKNEGLYSTYAWHKLFDLDKFPETKVNLNHILLVINNYTSVSVIETFKRNTKVLLLKLDHNLSGEAIYSEEQITINPVNEQDYSKLIKHLNENEIKIETIIHASSVFHQDDVDHFRALELGFYSLFMLKKSVLMNNQISRLIMLTNGLSRFSGNDLIFPENGALVGAIRNIKHEFPYVKSLIVDVGFNHGNLYENICKLALFDDKEQKNDLYAFRFDSLWLESIKKIKLFTTKDFLSNNDIVLITGGLGEIGLTLANEMASRHKLHFILISRSDPCLKEKKSLYDEKRKQLLESIKQHGSTFDVYCFDIADATKCQYLFQTIKTKNIKINGFIHAAGVPPLNLPNPSLDDIKHAFSGKVIGYRNIITNLANYDIKFVLNLSSLASLLGDVNRIDYCATNSALDYYSYYSRGLRSANIITVNLPAWAESSFSMKQKLATSATQGMTNQNNLSLKLPGENILLDKEGVEILYNLINQKTYSRVVVSKYDIEQMLHHFFENMYMPKQKNTDVIILENERSELEEKIAKIYCKVLGLNEISIDQNFFRLGGNSLMAVKLINLLAEINLKTNVSELFKYGTVRLLAQINEMKINESVEFGVI